MTRTKLLAELATLPLTPDTADRTKRFLATVPDDALPSLDYGKDNTVILRWIYPEQCRAVYVTVQGA